MEAWWHIRDVWHDWFKQCLVACSVPSHYLNQRWRTVVWTLADKLLWNLNENRSISWILKVSSTKWQPFLFLNVFTHWGRVTHIYICVSKLTIIGSDNGLSPGRRQAIIWTNTGILFGGPLETNYSEILIKIHIFSFTKMHLKMSFGKWRPLCLGLIVLSRSCWQLIGQNADRSMNGHGLLRIVGSALHINIWSHVSWHGNVFRITGPFLRGEYTDDRWSVDSPHKGSMMRCLDALFAVSLNKLSVPHDPHMT